MNNVTLLCNIIFHRRISKHFPNVKEVLQYWCDTKLRLAGFTQDAVVSAPHWQVLLYFYSSLNNELLDPWVATNFPVLCSRVSMIVNLIWSWPWCFWGPASSTVWVRILLLCLHSCLAQALESQGMGVSLEQGHR